MFDNILDTIGNTPLIPLTHIVSESSARVLVKLEGQNPGGSVKSRIGIAMLKAAAESGEFRWGKTTVVEPTSGNTGIGIAMAAAVTGNPCVLIMPASMSEERRALLAAYGARLELTPAEAGMRGAIARAEVLVEELEDAWMPNQFANPANPAIHECTTGPEIWRDTDGAIDAFVAGVGTGGTITGVARYLKKHNSNIEIIAVEPSDSPVLSGGEPGPNKIQGIGAGFIPEILDVTLLDRVITVSAEDAQCMTRRLAAEEGVFCGISSGAAAHVAVQVAATMETGRTVVTLLPDTGERYLSTGLFPVPSS